MIRQLTAAPANDQIRRVSSVAPRPRKGPLTEPIAAVQRWSRELVFLPHLRHSRPAARGSIFEAK
jgi:hypothetical protein